MSFRARLTLFFVLIVIVPMVAVALVLFRLISDNETGKANAGVSERQRAAITLYRDAARRAGAAVVLIGRDPALDAALRAGDAAAARMRLAQLVHTARLRRAVLVEPGGRVIAAGRDTAIAPARRNLFDPSGRRLGRLEVSTELATVYARNAAEITGGPVVVRLGSRTLASTIGPVPSGLPAAGQPGEVSAHGRSYRAASFVAADFLGRRLEVSVLSADAGRTSAIRRSWMLAAAILAGFLILALAFAVAVSRSLQRQIGALLMAARRLGSGDFSAQVPTEGRDEFSALGEEFNKMSRQLAARLDELSQERARVDAALRRIGESLASNLDRDALLELLVQTAVDGLQADGGRAWGAGGDGILPGERARSGGLDGLVAALEHAEAGALEQGRTAGADEGDVHALAQPLSPGGGGPRAVLSVARAGRPFGPADGELLRYLASQGAVSLENVSLHERVQLQAVTDELTGLYNHRRFQEALESETERARRFGQPLGLVMLDIDDFKAVNDTHGHQLGDRVLAEVARVLRSSAREIDSPARYGGEELAVVLPQTDLDGAYRLAERVRSGIEELRIALPGEGRELRVTASFGAACLGGGDGNARALLGRADAALYEAKRSGKNKTVRAS